MKGGKAGGKNYGGFFKGGGFPTSSPATERRKTIQSLANVPEWLLVFLPIELTVCVFCT